MSSHRLILVPARRRVRRSETPPPAYSEYDMQEGSQLVPFEQPVRGTLELEYHAPDIPPEPTAPGPRRQRERATTAESTSVVPSGALAVGKRGAADGTARCTSVSGEDATALNPGCRITATSTRVNWKAVTNPVRKNGTAIVTSIRVASSAALASASLPRSTAQNTDVTPPAALARSQNRASSARITGAK
ncbi:hypothetical protein Daesc_001088 [Daldinia eschscholtzii]|uniref:Uncharacterized protein n=1 Tax=Daldinia eschscholtzii TaxID=292717 RepID=A0AAX6N051_9PEZI